MRFEAIFPANRISNSALVYRANEYSFDVVPRPGNFTSVLFNDLNLELNEEGRVVSVWGLCPFTTWKNAALKPPKAEFGDAIFVPDTPLKRGVSLRLDRERWPIFVDQSSGWVQLQGKYPSATAVKVMTGVLLEIGEHGNLSSIWLKPDELPKLD